MPADRQLQPHSSLRREGIPICLADFILFGSLFAPHVSRQPRSGQYNVLGKARADLARHGLTRAMNRPKCAGCA